MSKTRYSASCDPGWSNCGFAILREDENGVSLVRSMTIDPRNLGGHVAAVDEMLMTLLELVSPSDLAYFSIERYVTYNGVHTSESENIVMLIGALLYGLSVYFPSAKVVLYRAIEWKMALVKLLVKNKGFDNPSSSLDKKFSIAAAHACLDIKGEFSNDHEGDCIATAGLALLKDRYAK